jgi:hypothetical protein
MVDRVANTFQLKPERLIADTAYGTGRLLDWLVQERGIAPHILVVDKSARKDGTYERSDFTHSPERDAYFCPDGKELKQSRRAFTTPRQAKPNKNGVLRYRSRGRLRCVCLQDPMLPKGTTMQGHTFGP